MSEHSPWLVKEFRWDGWFNRSKESAKFSEVLLVQGVKELNTDTCTLIPPIGVDANPKK